MKIRGKPFVAGLWAFIRKGTKVHRGITYAKSLFHWVKNAPKKTRVKSSPN